MQYPCSTGFVLGHYLNPKYFTYVDTISTDKFVYPVNIRDLAFSLGISREDLWEKHTRDIDIKETFFDCIPNHVLKKIQHGDVKLLINYGYEGNSIDERDTILYLEKFIVRILNKKNIKPENVYYTDSNLEIDNFRFNSSLNIFSHNYCALDFLTKADNVKEVDTPYNRFLLSERWENHFFKSDITKKFICYNRLHKNHRYKIVNWLKTNDYLDDGLVSYLQEHNNLKLILEDDLDMKMKLSYDKNYKDHYLKTFFSIVTESYFDSTSRLFLTEKTWKPILNYHPFVILGQSGTLKYLKKEGFDIFEDIFDSSYDKVHSKKVRFTMIIEILNDFIKDNNISDLKRLRKKIQTRLIDNKNHFWNSFIPKCEEQLYVNLRRK